MYYFNIPSNPTDLIQLKATTALDFANQINATYPKGKMGIKARREFKLAIKDGQGIDCTETALKCTLTLLAIQADDVNEYEELAMNLICALAKVMKKRAYWYFHNEITMLAINKVKFD